MTFAPIIGECPVCHRSTEEFLIRPTMADAVAAGDGTLHGAIDYWQNKCTALEAENAALRGDAERYRYLRQATINPDVLESLNKSDSDPVTPEAMDAAIDAAMKENGNG